MKRLSSAPRLAEFPTIELASGFTARNFDATPVSVALGWVADVHGQDEAEKLTGLPLSVIAGLYPDAMQGGVVTFAAIRDSPALGKLQIFADEYWTRFEVEDFNWISQVEEFSHWLRVKSGDWPDIYEWLQLEGSGIFDDAEWLAHTLTQAHPEMVEKEVVNDEWWGVHSVVVMLAVPVAAPPELYKRLKRGRAYFDRELQSLGLPQLTEGM